MSQLSQDEAAANASREMPLNALSFLIGRWQAISGPQEPTGEFSFSYQLQSQIILRTNSADYPATNERPAFRHEDLMVIFLDEAQNLRADYYDSEGHVIRYSGLVSGVNQVVFTDPPAPSHPGFRLSYHLDTEGKLVGAFEIAPPDQPDAFMPYLSWSANKILDFRRPA